MMKRSMAPGQQVAFAIALAMAAAASSCFRHVVSTHQLPTTAGLRFGSFAPGDEVHAVGEREYRFSLTDPAGEVYEVEQGSYRVTVRRAGVVQAQRVVYVASGETKEVSR